MNIYIRRGAGGFHYAYSEQYPYGVRLAQRMRFNSCAAKAARVLRRRTGLWSWLTDRFRTPNVVDVNMKYGVLSFTVEV